MNWFLTEEQQMIVDTAREIAVKKILPVREKYDHEGIFPWDVVKALAEVDLCGLYIPQEYGGFGGGVFELCLAVEELSKVCGGISLAMAATASGHSRSCSSAVMNRRRSIFRALPREKPSRRLD